MSNICKQCGYVWNERYVGTIPTFCPHCHSVYWNSEKTTKKGRIRTRYVGVVK